MCVFAALVYHVRRSQRLEFHLLAILPFHRQPGKVRLNLYLESPVSLGSLRLADTEMARLSCLPSHANTESVSNFVRLGLLLVDA